jgi:hypothetical protein
MSANFPTALPQCKTDYDSADNVASNDQNTQALEINALGAKVGIDSSATTTSHDYKLSGVTGTDKAVSKTGTETLTGKTLTSPVLNTGVSGTAVLDEDNMVSDSATKVATQQSIKAYGDNTFLTKASPVVSSGDIQLPDNGNVKDDASADPWKTISLSARAWQPTTTAGCASVVKIEAGTNDIDYDVLDFDTGTDENAYVNFCMPGNWDAGVIQFRYIWTNAAGLTTETLTFELSGISYADSDAIDAAVGTPVEVADTWLAQGDIHISAWSGDVTIAGTPAAGELVHLEIMRDISEDNLTGDARLIEVQIRYRESSYNHW